MPTVSVAKAPHTEEVHVTIEGTSSGIKERWTQAIDCSAVRRSLSYVNLSLSKGTLLHLVCKLLEWWWKNWHAFGNCFLCITKTKPATTTTTTMTITTWIGKNKYLSSAKTVDGFVIGSSIGYNNTSNKT